jgi:hypothetical protein
MIKNAPSADRRTTQPSMVKVFSLFCMLYAIAILCLRWVEITTAIRTQNWGDILRYVANVVVVSVIFALLWWVVRNRVTKGQRQ